MAIPLLPGSSPLWMAAPFQQPAFLTTDSRPFHTKLLVFSSPPDYQLSTEFLESESELLYDRRFTANQFVLETSPSQVSQPIMFFSNCTLAVIVLTRGWVCRLQLLLALASAVILRSVSHGTHDHILLCQIRGSHSLDGQVTIFISSRNWVTQLYPKALGPPFVASYDSQGYGECIRPAWCPRYITTLRGPRRKHRFQQFLYCCMRIGCRANVFTNPFSSSCRLFLLIKNV
jgi:hypothetical protein